MYEKNDYINVTKKHSLETEKINELFTHISKKKITELNELIYAGVKLEKNRGSHIKTLTQLKTWIGNSTGNEDKKYTTISKNDKTKESCWNMEQKENAKQEK